MLFHLTHERKGVDTTYLYSVCSFQKLLESITSSYYLRFSLEDSNIDSALFLNISQKMKTILCNEPKKKSLFTSLAT